MKTILIIVILLSLLSLANSYCNFQDKKVDGNPLHNHITNNSTL